MLRNIPHHPHRGPKMEWYFDELTEFMEVRCPETNKTVRVTLIKNSDGGLDDILACPYFEERVPTCDRGCLEYILEK